MSKLETDIATEIKRTVNHLNSLIKTAYEHEIIVDVGFMNIHTLGAQEPCNQLRVIISKEL